MFVFFLIKLYKVLHERYTEDKEDEILQCSNQIAQLQLRLDEAQSKAVEWETKYSYLQVNFKYSNQDFPK